MRTLLLAGAALMALPAALSAQQSADEANAQAQPAPPTTTVTPGPGGPATVTANPDGSVTVEPNPGAPATVTTNPDGSVTVEPNPGEPATVTTTYPGNLTPPPPQALNKTYPVCTRQLQDSCQNPGEGGAPGRSRALGYWPGEPASERTDRGG